MGSSSKVFETPTFDFDFSSMRDRKSAANTFDNVKSSWGNFFSERPKPVFTDEMTNLVKGS